MQYETRTADDCCHSLLMSNIGNGTHCADQVCLMSSYLHVCVIANTYTHVALAGTQLYYDHDYYLSEHSLLIA